MISLFINEINISKGYLDWEIPDLEFGFNQCIIKISIDDANYDLINITKENKNSFLGYCLKSRNDLKNELLYFCKGLIVIAAPLLFHNNETTEIFQYLNFDISETILINNNFLYLIL